MSNFESIFQESVIGKLAMADRIIFKGHLLGLYPDGAFDAFLYRQGVLLKNFKPFVTRATAEVKQHAKDMAAAAGRPYIYLDRPHTHASEQSKEDIAREIAKRDGVQEGLICVLSVLEPCWSFGVRGNHDTHRLEVIRKRTKCLHFYFYYLDSEFGFMHVRLQSWFPFPIQIYINGREWLCRQLDERGIGYERYDNALTYIENVEMAQRMCSKFFERRWPRLLTAFARKVNPWLPRIKRLGLDSYYWVTDQCEIATDVMFESRAHLQELMPDFFDHSLLMFSAEDTLRFLGRKPHGNFLGEVTVDLKRRPEGYRIKFRMKGNSIKMYDKWSVLRIETTINKPSEFRSLRCFTDQDGRRSLRWMPMRKGVADFWRFMKVGTQSNERFLEALAEATPQAKVLKELDLLSRPRRVEDRQFARFNILNDADYQLFLSALNGAHLINGFRNRDLVNLIYPKEAATQRERRRRCERMSRLIAKMRGHGMIAKVPRTRRYCVTQKGYRVMSSVLVFRRYYALTTARSAAA
jgi:hypothetical protein